MSNILSDFLSQIYNIIAISQYSPSQYETYEVYEVSQSYDQYPNAVMDVERYYTPNEINYITYDWDQGNSGFEIIKPQNLFQAHFGSDLIMECVYEGQKYKATGCITDKPLNYNLNVNEDFEKYPNGFSPLVCEYLDDTQYLFEMVVCLLSENKDSVLRLQLVTKAEKINDKWLIYTDRCPGIMYPTTWTVYYTNPDGIYPIIDTSGTYLSSINIYKMSPAFEVEELDKFVRYDTNSQDLTAEEQENARTNIGALSVGEKGQPNGVATLDSTGKVPLSQLPNSGGDVEGNAIKSTGQQSNLVLTSDGSGGALWGPYLPGVTTLAFIQEQIESSGGNFSGYWFEQKYPPVEDLSYDSVVGGLKYGFVETIMNRIKNIIEYELLYVIGAQDSDGVTVSVSIFPYTYDADMNEMKSFFEWSNCLVYERDEPPDGTPYWHENWVNFDRNIYYGMFTTPFSSLVSCSVIYENNSAGSTYDMVSKHLLTIPISLEMIANAFDIYWGSHPEE